MSISYFEEKSIKSQPQNRAIRVLSDDGARVIGVIRDSTFIKSNWHSKKHICWKHNAIGLDRAAFLNYVEPFAISITVYDKDTGREYRLSVEDFEQFGIQDDLGWGLQIFVPLRYWEAIEPDGTKPIQLNLWEEVTDATR